MSYLDLLNRVYCLNDSLISDIRKMIYLIYMRLSAESFIRNMVKYFKISCPTLALHTDRAIKYRLVSRTNKYRMIDECMWANQFKYDLLEIENIRPFSYQINVIYITLRDTCDIDIAKWIYAQKV
jgi:hypothetical protein